MPGLVIAIINSIVDYNHPMVMAVAGDNFLFLDGTGFLFLDSNQFEFLG